jgi:hypothetical protein
MGVFRPISAALYKKTLKIIGIFGQSRVAWIAAWT